MPRSSNPAARRRSWCAGRMHVASRVTCTTTVCAPRDSDRKSTRLNSSHTVISYAVFCLKKKKKKNNKEHIEKKTNKIIKKIKNNENQYNEESNVVLTNNNDKSREQCTTDHINTSDERMH